MLPDDLKKAFFMVKCRSRENLINVDTYTNLKKH